MYETYIFFVFCIRNFFVILIGPIWVESDNYIHVQGKMTWPDAVTYCKNAIGTDLASIHNSNEDSEIISSKIQSETYWIGLKDTDGDNIFGWNDDSSLDYTNWCDGQPNFGSASCGHIHHEREIDCWQPDSCSNKYFIICNS